MLGRREHGYAVMSPGLTGISFSDPSLETCKKYCYNGYVITKQTPYVNGFGITFRWFKYYKPFAFSKRSRSTNIFNLHIYWNKEYSHKTGEVVFRSEKK